MYKVVCPYCGEVISGNDPYAVASALLNHVFKRHHTFEPFKCFICKEVFNDPRSFIDHMVKEHKARESVELMARSCIEVARRGFSSKSKLKKRCQECIARKVAVMNGVFHVGKND